MHRGHETYFWSIIAPLYSKGGTAKELSTADPRGARECQTVTPLPWLMSDIDPAHLYGLAGV